MTPYEPFEMGKIYPSELPTKNHKTIKLALGVISTVTALSGVSLAVLGGAFVSTRLLLAAAGSAFIAAVTAIWKVRLR